MSFHRTRENSARKMQRHVIDVLQEGRALKRKLCRFSRVTRREPDLYNLVDDLQNTRDAADFALTQVHEDRHLCADGCELGQAQRREPALNFEY